MKLKLIIIIFATLFILSVAVATITQPNFYGWEWLKKSSSDIVVVHCGKVGPIRYDVGRFDATVEVVSALEGTNVNFALLWTDHPLKEGEDYLVFGDYKSGVPHNKIKPPPGPFTEKQKELRKGLIPANSIREGDWYVIVGPHETGRETGVYQAFEEYRVVPLGKDFSTNSIAGKPLDEQLQILYKRGIDVSNQEIHKAEEEKARLETAIRK